MTGAFDRIDIRGTNGLRLKDAWADSPRTYLGMLAEGFPNMLMVLGPHTARGNIPQAIEHSVDFQAGILRFMRNTAIPAWRHGPSTWRSGPRP